MRTSALVERYATELAGLLDGLISEYEGIERHAVGVPAVLVPRNGREFIRAGQIAGGVRFSLHGTGCRFETPAEEVLNLDWNLAGTASFGSWDVLMFARSVGDELVSRDEIYRELEDSPSLFQLEGDRFTWADRVFDLHFRAPSGSGD